MSQIDQNIINILVEQLERAEEGLSVSKKELIHIRNNEEKIEILYKYLMNYLNKPLTNITEFNDKIAEVCDYIDYHSAILNTIIVKLIQESKVNNNQLIVAAYSQINNNLKEYYDKGRGK